MYKQTAVGRSKGFDLMQQRPTDAETRATRVTIPRGAGSGVLDCHREGRPDLR